MWAAGGSTRHGMPSIPTEDVAVLSGVSWSWTGRPQAGRLNPAFPHTPIEENWKMSELTIGFTLVAALVVFLYAPLAIAFAISSAAATVWWFVIFILCTLTTVAVTSGPPRVFVILYPTVTPLFWAGATIPWLMSWIFLGVAHASARRAAFEAQVIEELRAAKTARLAARASAAVGAG